MSILSKIMNEKVFLENEKFHIVKDIDPVCEGHLLVFPKERQSAFLKLNSHERADLVTFLYKNLNDEYLIFEKGNVPFCTSFHEEIHCHLHLVPKKYFNGNIISNIRSTINPEISSTFDQKFDENSDKLYLLFGELNQIINIKIDFKKSEKRFIRNSLISNKI